MVTILCSVLFILFEKVKCVLHIFCEVKSPRTERELESLECFHEVWVNAVPAGGTCLLARRKEPFTGNRKAALFRAIPRIEILECPINRRCHRSYEREAPWMMGAMVDTASLDRRGTGWGGWWVPQHESARRISRDPVC